MARMADSERVIWELNQTILRLETKLEEEINIGISIARECAREYLRAEAAETKLAEVEAERDAMTQQARRHMIRMDTAEARLAAVEALCDRDNPYLGHQGCLPVTEVRAAARGEGDRPADVCPCQCHDWQGDDHNCSNCCAISGEGDRG